MTSPATPTADSLEIADFEMARLDELVRLWREAFEAGVGIVDPHPIEEQRQFFLDQVLPCNHVHMALRDGALVGFVAANLDSISQLHVRTTDRRRGIGTRLLDWAKARSSGRLWLYTFARNTGAQCFYEKHGFRIVARSFEPIWQLEDVKYEWCGNGRCGMPEAGAFMRTIEGDGFTLEPQVASHAEALFEVLVDPAIYAYENEPPPSVDWLRERFAKLESRRSRDGSELWLNWVVRLPGAGPIGYVQATVHPDGHAAIAYVLSSAHWGRGHASRAVGAMIGELQEHYAVRALTAVFKRDNLRSRRLLERMGFAPASLRDRERHLVEADELLMQRELVHP